MQPKLELLDHQTLVISPTQLASLRTCARMWHYTYMWRRVRAGAFAARDAGKAWDEAMNRRYREAGARPASPALETAMLADIDSGFAKLDLPLDEYRTAARYKEVARLYNDHYRDEPFDVLGVQVPFTVELGAVKPPPGFWGVYYDQLSEEEQDKLSERYPKPDDWPRVRVLLHGILDLLVRQRDSGLVLVVDTKTSNEWDARRQAEYDNSAQMKSYAWAVPEIVRQARARGEDSLLLARLPERVHGCMVNAVVIRKPYASDTRTARSNDKPRNEFHRFIVTYSQERLDEWRADTLLAVEQALTWVTRGHYPQTEKSCSFHYGGRCPYTDVCFVPKEQRELVLMSDLYQAYERGPLSAASVEREDTTT